MQETLDVDNDFLLDEDIPELTMTSLGKLVFTDTHSRHTNQPTPNISQNLGESLSLGFENLFYMPYDIIETYGTSLHTLDISHNKFGRNLHFLAEFENLTSLNLDHNNIDSLTVFPYMPKLQLLWVNHNKIDDLFTFTKNLYASLPNLQYLSLMGNKAAPSYFNGGTFYDYLQYRLFIISWFPRLMHLDDRIVTSEQRSEARRLFKRPFLEQLIESPCFPECLKTMHSKLTTFIFNPIMLPDVFKSSNKGPNVVV